MSNSIAREVINDEVIVSTSRRPLRSSYSTMIFGGRYDGDEKITFSKESALRFHNKMVDEIKGNYAG